MIPCSLPDPNASAEHGLCWYRRVTPLWFRTLQAGPIGRRCRPYSSRACCAAPQSRARSPRLAKGLTRGITMRRSSHSKQLPAEPPPPSPLNARDDESQPRAHKSAQARQLWSVRNCGDSSRTTSIVGAQDQRPERTKPRCADGDNEDVQRGWVDASECTLGRRPQR